MSSTDITRKKDSIQCNPFARSNAISTPGMAMGAVAIEQERAIAEAKAKLLIAKSFPRDEARSYNEILQACGRPDFARVALYSYPRGNKNVVTGPSIRLAELLARAWGNIEFGTRELSQTPGQSEMEAYAWDLETNTLSQQRFTVSHKSLARDARDLTDSRDIYERVANDGARRLRARILAVLPKDLTDNAVAECRKTLAGKTDLPMAERIRKMVSEFSRYSVTAKMLEEHLGHPLDKTEPEELVDLHAIFNSLAEGMAEPSRWFKNARAEGSAAQSLNTTTSVGSGNAQD